MGRCVVLLRGVNVGGSGRLAMADLRALLEELGGNDVRTHLQSGNAVLTWDGPPDALPERVSAGLRERLSLDVAVLVRTATELGAVVSGCPFAGHDPRLLHAVFLDAPAPALPELAPDRVVVGDRVVYVAYAHDAHSSKAARLFSSKAFPVVATARNWRTVTALHELVSA